MSITHVQQAVSALPPAFPCTLQVPVEGQGPQGHLRGLRWGCRGVTTWRPRGLSGLWQNMKGKHRMQHMAWSGDGGGGGGSEQYRALCGRPKGVTVYAHAAQPTTNQATTRHPSTATPRCNKIIGML